MAKAGTALARLWEGLYARIKVPASSVVGQDLIQVVEM
jgi:hypothetical protein